MNPYNKNLDTKLKIDRIKKVLAGASPGPWKNTTPEHKAFQAEDLLQIEDSTGELVCNFGVRDPSCTCEGYEPTEGDTELIINAPEYIAWLVKELEEWV
jgi:hypothetical protein